MKAVATFNISRHFFVSYFKQRKLQSCYFGTTVAWKQHKAPPIILQRPSASSVTANHVNTKKVKYVDDLSSAQYYFENGLRKVKPYYFDYLAHAKDRWVGQRCLDVMKMEFRDRNEAYFRQAIAKGFITINGLPVTNDTLFQKGDTLGHRVHRHEPPASAEPIRIIYKDDDLMVIEKPAGMQAHPSGRYRHNTVTHIMRKQYNLPSLYPINRLDRVTSGLMMIGLNAKKAQELQQEMTSGNVQKEYLCRVDGEFPTEPVVCIAPMRAIAFKFSFNYVDFSGNGKPSKSVFERISYNGRSSLVRCQPITGRTHQLRAHLRYLGYPIVNDPTLGRQTAWSTLLDNIDPYDHGEKTALVVEKMLEKTTYDSLDTADGQPRCQECRGLLVPDPLASQELGIFLHSRKYTGSGWAFETKDEHLPSWAKDDFVDDITPLPAYL